MKRVLIALMLCLVSIVGFAQLNIQTPEEMGCYKVVYEVKGMGQTYGEIRYNSQIGYILLGRTDNQFEKSMASILLGISKENTIQSLNDLKTFTETNEHYKISIVSGIGNKKTKIYTYDCGFGLNGLYMETEYVAGKSYVGTWIFQTKKLFNKAITAINNFEEPQK